MNMILAAAIGFGFSGRGTEDSWESLATVAEVCQEYVYLHGVKPQNESDIAKLIRQLPLKMRPKPSWRYTFKYSAANGNYKNVRTITITVKEGQSELVTDSFRINLKPYEADWYDCQRLNFKTGELYLALDPGNVADYIANGAYMYRVLKGNWPGSWNALIKESPGIAEQIPVGSRPSSFKIVRDRFFVIFKSGHRFEYSPTGPPD